MNERSDGFPPTGQNYSQAGRSPNTNEMTGPYQFTPEELRVLNECNRESFFQRCVPLASILGIGTHYAVKIGYFKGHSAMGSIPKVGGAILVGYILGKISYQAKCAQKLMDVPNSKIGQILRDRRRAGKGGLQESLDPSFGTGISVPATFTFEDEPLPQETKRMSYLDMDDRPHTDYDFQRPLSYDSMNMELSGLPEKPPEHKITYEELRKRNRQEYDSQRTRYVRPPPDQPPPPMPPVDNNPMPPLSGFSNPDSYKPQW